MSFILINNTAISIPDRSTYWAAGWFFWFLFCLTALTSNKSFFQPNCRYVKQAYICCFVICSSFNSLCFWFACSLTSATLSRIFQQRNNDRSMESCVLSAKLWPTCAPGDGVCVCMCCLMPCVLCFLGLCCCSRRNHSRYCFHDCQCFQCSHNCG